MSKHMIDWLGAYLDGELHGSQLHHMQAHLAECELCRSELESLKSLSGLLHEVPAPQFMPSERFAAQVGLRLPHTRIAVSRNRILEIGWWMVPVALLATWIFISTSFFINDMLSAANTLGLLRGISNWLVVGSPGEAYWSAMLGQFGILSGNSLELAASTEAITRTSLPQISLQVSIALLYLSWIAIWWTRHNRQGHGQLLEG